MPVAHKPAVYGRIARTIEIGLTSFKPLSDGHTWQVAAWIRVGGAWTFNVAPVYMAEESRTDVMITAFVYNLDDPKQIPDRVVAFTIDRFGIESARVSWIAGEKK